MVNTQKNDDIKTLNNQCEEKICLDDTKSDLIEKEIKNILEIIDKRIIENINIKTHKVGADDMKNEKRKQAIYEYKEKKTTGGVLIFIFSIILLSIISKIFLISF